LKKAVLYIALCFVLVAPLAFGQYDILRQSDEWQPLHDVLVEGNIFLRMPGALEYDWFPSDTKIPEYTLGYVMPDTSNPLATDSYIVLGHHKVYVYPSATFRLSKCGIIPLSGRFEFVTEETAQDPKPITIETRKSRGEYTYGNLLIEVTPDSGIFIAMRGVGQAWFKDHFLQTHILQENNEIYYPLYGKTSVAKRLGTLWQKPPQSFGNLKAH
jgi:hypothetical protein